MPSASQFITEICAFDKVFKVTNSQQVRTKLSQLHALPNHKICELQE